MRCIFCTSVANMFTASSNEKIMVKVTSSASKMDSVVADAVQGKNELWLAHSLANATLSPNFTWNLCLSHVDKEVCHDETCYQKLRLVGHIVPMTRPALDRGER